MSSSNIDIIPEKLGEYEVRYFCHRLSSGCNAATFSRIGRSAGGRDIVSLEVGQPVGGTLIVGGSHGMEWISCAVALKLAADFCTAIQSSSAIHGIDISGETQKAGVVFVPLINPDGLEIARNGATSAGSRLFRMGFNEKHLARWQANGKGVDINRNFPAGFYKAKKLASAAGCTKPAPARYGGRSPFSEPETRALRNLCNTYRFRTVISLHSQGEEIYWKYGKKLPPHSKEMATTLSELTGYALAWPDPIASHAGFKDWFIKRYNRPGFTIELGAGKNPLPYSCFHEVYERVERALVVSTVLC